MYHHLFAALRELKDTGPKGFEGLVKALLDGIAPTLAITFLSRSGWQAGVDASSAGLGRAWVGLECKHYEAGTCPPTRDLTGGLNNALSAARDNLDAWLLVTTGAIDNNSAIEFARLADREHIDIVVVDWQSAGLPRLAVLCAADTTLTISGLTERSPEIDRAAILDDLSAIRVHQGFASAYQALKEQLSAPSLGFGTARMHAANSLVTRLRSEKNARASWRQPLCPLDRDYAPLIDRPAIRDELNVWWMEWSERPSVGLVHGKEGVGKSWAALDWWTHLEEQPLTLLITSNIAMTSEEPLDLVCEALDRQLGTRGVRFWSRRFERWLRRPVAKTASILVIFDGLNERSREDWPGRIVAFFADTLRGHLAVIATCWTDYWCERMKGFQGLGDTIPISKFPIPPYDEATLARVLAPLGVAVSALNPRTRELLLMPRICHLAITRFSHLITTGDLTVERMLISDWSHRMAVKSGLRHNDQEFNQLVVSAARDLRSGQTSFERDKMRHFSRLARRDPNLDLTRDFDEIIHGNLFEPDDAESDTWRIKSEHVGLAVGMLLAEDARQATKNGPAAVTNVIATAMDLYEDFSLASEVYRGAVATACITRDFPQAALRGLLLGWLALRNRPDDHHDDFKAYLQDQPEAFLDTAEEVWPYPERYVDGQDWLRHAFLHHKDDDAVFEPFLQQSRRWLGFWCRSGHPVLSGHKDEDRRDKIVARLATATSEESRAIGELSEMLDPASVELAELALLVLSARPDLVTMDHIACWALSRAVMGYAHEREDVAWLIRLSKTEGPALEAGMFAQVDQCIAMGGDLGRAAAWNLLYVCGSKAAYARFDEVGGINRGKRWVRDFFPSALDPHSLPADLSHARELLAQLDPASVHAAMGHTDSDGTFEEIEKGFTAHAPHEFAGFVRRMLATADAREYLPLRQLSWHAPEYGLLVGQEEAHALESARAKMLPLCATEEKRDWLMIEANCLHAILPSIPPSERLDLLSARPAECYLLTDFEENFGELPSNQCVAALSELASVSDIGRIRATLFYLSQQNFDLDDQARACLFRLLEHNDRVVRLLAFRVAIATQDDATFEHHRAGEWRAHEHNDKKTVEGFYGSLMLGLGSGPIHYADLRNRVALELLGWIAMRDGSDDAALAFAEDLDMIWQHLTRVDALKPTITVVASVKDYEDGTPTPLLYDGEDLPIHGHAASLRKPSDWARDFRQAFDSDAFDLRQEENRRKLDETLRAARDARKLLFPGVMRLHGLKRALNRRPDLIDRWLAVLEGDDAARVLAWAAEFYRAVAVHLLEFDPARGANLLSRLLAARGHCLVRFLPLKVDAAIYTAFKKGIPASAPLRALREQMLDEALTDEALFVMALVAQQTGHIDWLCEIIDRDLNRDAPWYQARALTLIGWLDNGAALDRFRVALDEHDGFLKSVADTANTRLLRNHQARHWFGAFLSNRDPVTAWAALRLFLRCVDRRYYLWRQSTIGESEGLPGRWRETLTQNRQAIERAIQRNEKDSTDLENLLFGDKIPKTRLAPWL